MKSRAFSSVVLKKSFKKGVTHCLYGVLQFNSDFDECQQTRFSRECLNGGACVNTVGSFTCTCTDDYTGLMCERGKAATTTICVRNQSAGRWTYM